MSHDYISDQIKMACCCFASLGYNVRFWQDSGPCLSVYSQYHHMDSEEECSLKCGYKRHFYNTLAKPDTTPVVLKNNCDPNYNPIYDQEMLSGSEDDEN
jgi:hypothetical protein